MKKNTPFISALYIALSAAFLLNLYSCTDYEKEKPAAVLMKTPVLTLSISEFLEELELKKVSYPYAVNKNSDEYNDILIDLVNTLSEELVLLSAAQTKGIEVSQEEFEAKAQELRKEYTEEQFADILLEKAIPLSLWKKRLKKNIILEKLIDSEVKRKIEIAPEELVEFYKNYNADNYQDIQKKDSRGKNKNKNHADNKSKSKQPAKRKNEKHGKSENKTDNQENAGKRKELKDEQELIVLLRLQKTQKIYEEWIKKLEQEFPVEINREKLKKLFK